MTARQVVVVGAGAAGVLVAAHLADAAARTRLAVHVHVIDPDALTGRGIAYRTQSSGHLLNVPCGRMSAWPQDPDHFLRWLRSERGLEGGEPVAAGEFVTRSVYGRYLHAVLQDRVREAGDLVRLDRVHDRAVDLDLSERPGLVTLASGRVLRADSVVLALGNQPPASAWAPPSLRASHRFIADPWAADSPLSIVTPSPTPAPSLVSTTGTDGMEPIGRQTVLVVGTGLTMVDAAIALTRAGHRVHAVSRRGLLPRAHRRNPRPAMATPRWLTDMSFPSPGSDAASRVGLAQLRRIFAAHVETAVGEHGDWRPAVDSLRPITTALWRGLSTVDRAEFLAEDASGWDSLRHRMAPSVAHALTTARRSGAVTVGRGQVAWAKEHADGLQVGMADGHVLNPHWVLNCTGPATDLTRSTCPLTRALLVVGSARPGELGIGLDTDDDGRLLGADGVAVDTVWTLGSLRRGQLWESTAIPELRAQAADLAGRLLKETVPRTPRPRGTRMDSSRSHTEKPVRLDLAAMR